MKRRLPPPANPCDNIYEEFQKIQTFFAKVHKNTRSTPTIYMRQKLGGTMLTEVELQKQWENLTFTDDFIFSRVMHDENICPQGRFPETSTTGVLRGRRGFAGAQPRLAKVAVPLATFRPKGRRSLPKRCWGSRSKHAVRSFQRRGGFRRGKPPLPSRGVAPS